MRLNRGTLIILAVSIIVIVAAYVLTNNLSNQAVEASPTPAGGGPLFADLTSDSIISLAVSDNASEAFTRLARESSEADWAISGPEDAETRELDPEAVTTVIDNAATLVAETQFDVEDLAEFGLDNPAYTVEIDTGTTLYVVLIGNENPGSTRNYVQRREIAASDGDTAAATADSSVYLVMHSDIAALTDLITSPPYQPLPTATTTPTATLNPLSEVEQATATAEAQATATTVFATLAAETEATQTAEAEATPEVTAEPTES